MKLHGMMGSPILVPKVEVGLVRGLRPIRTFEAHVLLLWNFLVLLEIPGGHSELIMIIWNVVVI